MQHQEELSPQFMTQIPQGISDVVDEKAGTQLPGANLPRTPEVQTSAARAMSHYAELDEEEFDDAVELGELQDRITPESTKLGGRNKRNTEKNSMGKNYAAADDKQTMSDLHQQKAKQKRGGTSVTDQEWTTFATTGELPQQTVEEKPWLQKPKGGTPQTRSTASEKQKKTPVPREKKEPPKKADKYANKGKSDYTNDDAINDMFL